MAILSDTGPTGPTLQGGGSPIVDWLSGFAKSSISSLPELIGIDPSEDVLRWRQENPIGGFASEMITPLGEFGAASKLGKMALRGSSALQTLSETHPILGGLVEGTAGMLPISAGRVAGAAIAGGNAWDVAKSALIDTAVQGGLGGLGGLVRGAGERIPKDPFSLSDLAAPPQLKAREVLDQLASLPPDKAPAAVAKLAQWSAQIRGETGSESRPFFGFVQRPLVKQLGDMEAPAGADSRQLNRLFAMPKLEEGATPATVKRRLTSTDFGDDATLAKVTADASLPPNYEFHGQNFRHISFTNQQAAGNTAKVVRNNLIDVGDGWFLGREQDLQALGAAAPADQGGLYIMAKRIAGPAKVRAGQPIGNAADQWLVFKSDDPGFFKPAENRFSNTVSKWSWDPMEDPELQLKYAKQPFFSDANSMNKTIPELSLKTGPNAMLGKLAPSEWAPATGQLIAKALGWGDAGAAVDVAKNFFREHFAPMMYQFGNNPTARKIAGTMSALFRKAEQMATADIYGAGEPIKGSLTGATIRSAITGGAREGGLADLVRGLGTHEMDQLNSILANQELRTMLPDKLPGSVTSNVKEIMKRIQDLDLKNYSGMRAAEDAAAIPEDERLKHLSGHLSLTRSWLGNWRVPVRDEFGDLISMGSGRTRGQAQKMAKALTEEAQAAGKKWTTNIHDVHDTRASHGFDLESERAFKPRSKTDWNIINRVESAGKRGFYEQRAGVGGYVGEKGFTKQELIDSLHEHALQLNRRQATLAVKSVFKDNLTKLHEADRSLAGQLMDRLEQLNGRQGEFSRLVNTASDKLLAPFIGSNSASRIAGVLSKYLYGIRYGFMAMGLPVANMLNFVQTHFPEMSFLSGGAPENIVKYYSHSLVLGADGMPKGKVGIMQMMKMQLHSLMQLKNPDPAFRKILSEAVANGDLDQRMVKEFIGGKASIRDHWRDFKEAKGVEKGWHFAKFLHGLGTLPADVTERLSRLQTYALAYNYGKDVLGLAVEGGGLRQFMNEFTSRTMFNYGTSDKAKIFSGPIGSSIGLFKNWMLHYYFNMLDYIGEASRGNVKPLLYAAALPALAGGAPATGGLYFIADRLQRLYSNKPLMERIYEGLGSDDPSKASPADLIYQGLPGYLPKLLHLPGFSLTQQVAAPMQDPAGELNWMATPVLWDQGKLAVKALTTLRQGYAATGSATPDAWSQLARAFMPKTFYQGMNGWSEGMIRSANTTAPMVTNLTPMERVYYALGLNPSRTALYYNVKTELTAEQQDRKALISKMGQEWALAEDTGNSAMMKRVITRALVRGLDITSIMHSARGYSKRLNENGLSNNLNRARVAAMQRATGVNMPMPLDDYAVQSGT